MTLQTLSTAVSIFLRQGHLKPSTRKAYKQILDRLISYIGPDRPLIDIEPVEIQKFWNRISEQKYSPHTLNKHIRSLKAFFNWSVDMRLIDHSPAVRLKRPRLPGYITREKAMTDDEYSTLLNYARKTSARNYALILFLGDTGCRAIAASRLKRADLNLEDRTAVVTGKGDRQRIVYYGEECRRALVDWLNLKPLNTSDYVFRERGRGQIKPDNISQIIRRTAERAGIERTLGSHSLRHRKGHQLADRGTPITVSAKALGHVSAQTTQNYYPDDDERVRQALDDLATKPQRTSPKIIRLRR